MNRVKKIIILTILLAGCADTPEEIALAREANEFCWDRGYDWVQNKGKYCGAWNRSKSIEQLKYLDSIGGL